ncbi:MAG: hypothetical protein HYS98_05425, partial [Deltaproteobacteria bacterium]|nr:hypothetical protein [Deltaproteobacteria bacterium]
MSFPLCQLQCLDVIAGCEEIEPLPALSVEDAVQLQCIYVSSPSFDSSQVSALREKIATVTKEEIQKRLFEKLKEQALLDQVKNHLDTVHYMNRSEDQQEWAQKNYYTCINKNTYPQALSKMNEYIQLRNDRYKNLSKIDFSNRIESEYTAFKRSLVEMARSLQTIEMRANDVQAAIKEAKNKLMHSAPAYYLKEAEGREWAENLRLFQESIRQQEAELDNLQFQSYLILNSHPILALPLANKSDTGIPLYPLLARDIGSDQVDSTVQKALRLSRKQSLVNLLGDDEKDIEGLCNLNYSEENLRKLSLLSGLTANVIPKLDGMERQVACDYWAHMDKEQGMMKTALYFGGAGLACGLGWFVSGGASCLVYAGIFGAAGGAYETYHAVQDIMQKKEEYRFIHDLFLSDVENASLALAKEDRQALTIYKQQVGKAWMTGVLTLAGISGLGAIYKSGKASRELAALLRAQKANDTPTLARLISRADPITLRAFNNSVDLAHIEKASMALKEQLGEIERHFGKKSEQYQASLRAFADVENGVLKSEVQEAILKAHHYGTPNPDGSFDQSVRVAKALIARKVSMQQLTQDQIKYLG